MRRLMLPQTEARWQADVLNLAATLGWSRELVYHTHDSRKSVPGWPDLALCKPPRLILAEIKTDRGELRPEQVRWLTALRACRGVECYVWRPRDWDHITLVLSEMLPMAGVALPFFCAWCSPVGCAPWATSGVCATHLAQQRQHAAAAVPHV